MNRIQTSLALTAVLGGTVLGYQAAFGIGGRGGGGGGFGGGGRAGGGGFSGAAARPAMGSAPSFNRPAAPTARPAARPATGAGNRPAVQPGTRPNVGAGAGARPGAGAGNRPAAQPGTRPNIAAGAEVRPSTLPGTRPGIGAGQGIGSGAGVATRPAAGAGQGIANRPGISQQPARLPGLGQGTAGSRLPNQGAGVQDRMANRPQTAEARQANLSDRMSSGREDWQQHRNDVQNDRQDWRDNNREDWQNYADHNHNHYGDFYHGCWHGGWYPGAGWNHMWDYHPVAAAFGVTVWGVNRIAYGFGYSSYSNPYSGGDSGSYDYSEPLVSYSDPAATAAPTDPGTPAAAGTEPAPEAVDPGMQVFNDARDAFANGDAAKALTLLDTTLKTMPRDTVVHEFRSLVLFALKKYPESAAAIYAVLAAGPGWDWTTMSSLYPSVDVYTQHLRALEAFAKDNPKSADAHFLLGYHYLTATHPEAASKQFSQAQQLLPDDKLITQLVGMTAPPDSAAKSAPVAAPAEPVVVPADKVLTADKMVGTWKASSDGAQFQLDLAQDGKLVWSFTRGKDMQTVKGVFAVDQNNLALEPDAGGTMLAEIGFVNPSQFLFQMIGGEAKDPGLQFKKS